MQKMFLAGIISALYFGTAHALDPETELLLAERVYSYKFFEDANNYFPWDIENNSRAAFTISMSCGLVGLKFSSLNKISGGDDFSCDRDCPEMFSLLDGFCRTGFDFSQKYLVLHTRKHDGVYYLLESFPVHADGDHRLYVSERELIGYFPADRLTSLPKNKQECIDLEYVSQSFLDLLLQWYFVEIDDSSVCYSEGVYLEAGSNPK